MFGFFRSFFGSLPSLDPAIRTVVGAKYLDLEAAYQRASDIAKAIDALPASPETSQIKAENEAAKSQLAALAQDITQQLAASGSVSEQAVDDYRMFINEAFLERLLVAHRSFVSAPVPPPVVQVPVETIVAAPVVLPPPPQPAPIIATTVPAPTPVVVPVDAATMPTPVTPKLNLPLLMGVGFVGFLVLRAFRKQP